MVSQKPKIHPPFSVVRVFCLMIVFLCSISAVCVSSWGMQQGLLKLIRSFQTYTYTFNGKAILLQISVVHETLHRSEFVTQARENIQAHCASIKNKWSEGVWCVNDARERASVDILSETSRGTVPSINRIPCITRPPWAQRWLHHAVPSP